MGRRNVLTEQSILVDEVLSKLTGRPIGALLAFTEITQALHNYIRSRGLRIRFCPHCNSPLATPQQIEPGYPVQPSY